MKCFQIFTGKSSRRGREDESLTSQKRAPNVPEMYREREHHLRTFSLAELQKATNNFNSFLKVGEGFFGSVYRGSLKPSPENHPTIVAIKKLNAKGLQGYKQWVAEVQFLGVLDHPNLVKLVGYCSLDGKRGIQRLLVCEYMQNKSLEDHLFNRDVPTIPWITRINIILGAAQGLAYLHEGLEVQVIYLHFKSSKVLLDKDFTPKLSDFGPAKEGPTGDPDHVSIHPLWTHAPLEYVMNGHMSVKCDIWSFGLVLYEILTGRRTLERTLPPTQRNLLEWVKLFPADSKKFNTIIDPRLQNQYSVNAARRIAKLADMCLTIHPKGRPSMSQVVEVLKQAKEDSERTCSSSSITSVAKQFS